MYNQYNLEAKLYSSVSSFISETLKNFRSFLNAEEISKGSVRSYLSDVHHFLNWLENFLRNNHLLGFTNSPPDFNVLLGHINQKVLEAYKGYQISNNTPVKTINRRFSSLRRFGEFCKSQNWCTSNPFETLRNISIVHPFPEDRYHLTEFRTELWKNGASKLTTKNYLNDIKQFIQWTDSSK